MFNINVDTACLLYGAEMRECHLQWCWLLFDHPVFPTSLIRMSVSGLKIIHLNYTRHLKLFVLYLRLTVLLIDNQHDGQSDENASGLFIH